MRVPLLEARGVKKYYPVKTGALGKSIDQIKAVDGIDLDICSNETVGLVGESGCGKSTFARLILRLERIDAGTITFDGIGLGSPSKKELQSIRKGMQIIFQDPFGSLNPRKKILSLIEEPLVIHKIGKKEEIRHKALEAMEWVGLHKNVSERYPHEFSGGQRQRICIARSLVLRPKLIICDEPVSALDVSIQAQVINLLIDLQQKFHLSYLFISHALSIVGYVAHRVAVMYRGNIVEMASTASLYDNPMHPYTQLLFASAPVPDPRYKKDKISRREVSLNTYQDNGCVFSHRCSFVNELCVNRKPHLVDKGNGHFVACHIC